MWASLIDPAARSWWERANGPASRRAASMSRWATPGPTRAATCSLLGQVLLGAVPVFGWAQGPDDRVAAGGQQRAQPVDAAQLGDRVRDDPERGLVRDTQAAGGGLGDREQLPGADLLGAGRGQRQPPGLLLPEPARSQRRDLRGRDSRRGSASRLTGVVGVVEVGV